MAVLLDLKQVQKRLQDEGFYAGAIDGILGRLTLTAADLAVHEFGWSKERKLVAYQQTMMTEAGIEIGPIDGLVGPQTRAGVQAWVELQRTGNLPTWRDDLMAPRLDDDRFPAPVKERWPRQSEMRDFYGAPGTGHTMLELPFPMRLAWDKSVTITRFAIHARCAPSAARVFRNILDAYGFEKIQELRLDLFGGCYNKRKMRGGTQWSTHAYAAAIDIDPEHNQLKWGKDKASLAKEPPYGPYWDAWSAEGWLSLGKARNIDFMHIQCARLG